MDTDFVHADPAGMAVDIGGRDNASLPVVQRHRRGAKPFLQLLIHDGIAVAAHPGDDPPQLLRVGSGVWGELVQVGRGQIGVELLLGKPGQEHPAHGRAVGGQAHPDAEGDTHDPLGWHTRHVDDLLSIEHRYGAGLMDGAGQFRQIGLGDIPEGLGGQVGVSKAEDLGRKLELLPLHTGVTQRHQREQEPAGRSAGQMGDLCYLAQRHAGPFRPEGLDHGQPTRQ